MQIPSFCKNFELARNTLSRRNLAGFSCAFLLATLIFSVQFASAQKSANWAQFRGDGNGSASASDLPTEWDDKTNVRWKTELEGTGASSPVIYDGKVFLTSCEGPKDDVVRRLVCYKLDDGELVFDKKFSAKAAQGKMQPFVRLHGYASSTPAIDETGIYVYYGASGAVAYSHKGEVMWETSCGEKTHIFGTANSPVIYKDTVVINASVESGRLIGLDKKTGKEKWSKDGMKASWNTPNLFMSGSKAELVLSIKGRVLSFNPETGDEIWSSKGIDDYICPSVISNKGIVYAIGARQSSGVAIKAGGTGDVSESNVLWRMKKGSNVSSPVFHDGHLYWASEKLGVVYCANAEDGKIVYQERLDPKPGIIYASPIVANGKLYYVSREKGTYVVAAKPEYELLAHNVFKDDSSIFNGSPAVSGNKMILRSDKSVYCITK